MPTWPAIAHILSDEQVALSPPALRSEIAEDRLAGEQYDRADAPMSERRLRFWLASHEDLSIWIQWAGRHGHKYFGAPAATSPIETARIVDGLVGVELTAHVAADRSVSWFGACEIERPA